MKLGWTHVYWTITGLTELRSDGFAALKQVGKEDSTNLGKTRIEQIMQRILYILLYTQHSG